MYQHHNNRKKGKKLTVEVTSILLVLAVSFLLPSKAAAFSGCLDYGMAYDDGAGYCRCMSGYVWGKGALGQAYCVSADSYCTDKYGYHSRYNSLSDSCECGYGYAFGKDMFGDTKCIDEDSLCQDKIGYNARYNSLTDKCECRSGYELSLKTGGGLTCESCSTKYGYHSSYSYSSKKCECDNGYTLNDNNQCVEKQNNVYFNLIEATDDKILVESAYNYQRYILDYGIGCPHMDYYTDSHIVINLGTDFDIDDWDKIILPNNSEVCSILGHDEVDNNFTFKTTPNNPSPMILLSSPTVSNQITAESDVKNIFVKPSSTQASSKVKKVIIKKNNVTTTIKFPSTSSVPQTAVSSSAPSTVSSNKPSVWNRTRNAVSNTIRKLKFW